MRLKPAISAALPTTLLPIDSASIYPRSTLSSTSNLSSLLPFDSWLGFPGKCSYHFPDLISPLGTQLLNSVSTNCPNPSAGLSLHSLSCLLIALCFEAHPHHASLSEPLVSCFVLRGFCQSPTYSPILGARHVFPDPLSFFWPIFHFSGTNTLRFSTHTASWQGAFSFTLCCQCLYLLAWNSPSCFKKIGQLCNFLYDFEF